MKKDKLRINEIQQEFISKRLIKLEELHEFYLRNEPELNKATLRWRVHRLVGKGILSKIQEGLYIVDKRKVYEPFISNVLKRTYNYLRKEFPYIDDLCIWDTAWLHDFMDHQPVYSYHLVEVDKEVIEQVFSSLHSFRENVFLHPKQNEVNKYVVSNNSIIVKPYLKSSPVTSHKNTKIPKLEKILVDIFSERSLFSAYQGHEMVNIYERIYSEYNVNLTILYRYAKSRNVRGEIRDFVNSIEIGKTIAESMDLQGDKR